MTMNRAVAPLVGVLLVGLLAGLLTGCTKTLEPDRLPADGTVLVRMTDWQEPWFAEKVKNWPDRGSVALATESYQDLENLPDILRTRRAPKAGGSFLLVKVEGRMLPALIDEGLIIPVDAIAADENPRPDWKSEFLPEALEPAVRDGVLWALPRKIENHVLVARRGAVRDAALYWTSLRDEIDAIFRFENGRGLPEGYSLEMDPAQWTTYDVAVAGYYWSHAPIKGETAPRLGHRTRDYPGTFVDQASRVFSLGGTPDELTALRGQALKDFLLWEAFFLRYGLYPAEMTSPGWFGGDMYKAFQDGRLLATTVHQLDASTFHDKFAPDDNDERSSLMVSAFPKGVSLDLDAGGRPVRTGFHRSHAAGWWWAVPAHCPCPRLALRLARWLTSRDFQRDEARRFGIYPIRRDLWDDLEATFPSPFMRGLLETSRDQFEQGCPMAPDDRVRFRSAAVRLVDLWQRVATHPKLHDRSVPLGALGLGALVDAP